MSSKLRIAYFSMEFGLQDWMKTWCGGLGILAGDTIKSATDLGISMTGISLLHKKGWFKQSIDGEGQTETDDSWNYFANLKLLSQKVKLNIWDRTVTLAIWEYKLVGENGFTNKVYFLDSDIPENNDWDRQLTNQIYPTNYDIFLTQETLLGIGGIKLLEVLDLAKDISVYHLNESHCMSVALALKKNLATWDQVRQKICFTTHTPLEGGHQKETLEKLKYFIPAEYFEQIPKEILDQNGNLNFTTMCIFSAKFTNGVSKRHRDTTAKMYPDYTIDFVTNGIHPHTWISPYISEVFDQHLGNWKNNLENLKLAPVIPNEDYQKAHQKAKEDLISVINLHSKMPFDSNLFTIGFARRAAPYKRPDLIFSQFERLHQIADKFDGLQIVFAGKALPGLDESKQIIKSLVDRAKQSDINLRVVFLPNYGIRLSQLITGGVDLWLNNPLPPLEASGTSGMKASINGTPNFSILDGWWPEACVEGITGWSIGQDLCEGDECRLEELSDLYEKLENNILPIYYHNQDQWLTICKNNIAQIGSRFNTHRMLLEYAQKGYLK